jgi:hypothetical protein
VHSAVALQAALGINDVEMWSEVSALQLPQRSGAEWGGVWDISYRNHGDRLGRLNGDPRSA